ncbi:MAG: hypothetical protein IPJ31_16815 [Bacteroidetes bacterium]|nr:hypothetical protein [Bacteroidota bacterium]MBP6314067.1 hypothetical protein [Chitinophagaceae bacterium]
MKKQRITLILLFLGHLVFAQKAETIQSFATNPQSMMWYKQQLKAWEKELSKDEKNENAWHNLFKAQRYITNHDTTDKRKGTERQVEMQAILDRMQEAIPNTYTVNYCNWVFHGNDMNYYSFLERAVAIDPHRPDHIDYMINIGEMQRNVKQRDEFSLRKIETGQMSPGLLYYNYNTLIGLEKNAILVTSGDNDTYPVWALQAKGIRRDVKVINRYLISLKAYREKMFKELGIEADDLDNVKPQGPFNEKLLQVLHSNSNHFPVYSALTCTGDDVYSDKVAENLFLVGLAYAYKTSAFDNMAAMRKNVETLFAIDYLDKVFYEDFAAEKVKEVNRNYIVPFIKLYVHYKEAGELQKQNWIKEKLILLSKGNEEEETVLKFVD